MSLTKKPWTALSQDAEVGVKWNVQRGIPRQPSWLSRLHVCVIQQQEFHDDQTDDTVRRFSGRVRAPDSLHQPSRRPVDAQFASLVVRIQIMDLTGTGP